MRGVIRLGDATSHGGKVISASAAHFTVDGSAVARVGDVCSCPIKGHDNCTIAERDAGHVVAGISVAYDGDKTTCGATLISTTVDFQRD